MESTSANLANLGSTMFEGNGIGPDCAWNFLDLTLQMAQLFTQHSLPVVNWEDVKYAEWHYVGYM